MAKKKKRKVSRKPSRSAASRKETAKTSAQSSSSEELPETVSSNEHRASGTDETERSNRYWKEQPKG